MVDFVAATRYEESQNTAYWATRFYLLKTIKEAFDANGIEIPFPQITVHKG